MFGIDDNHTAGTALGHEESQPGSVADDSQIVHILRHHCVQHVFGLWQSVDHEQRRTSVAGHRHFGTGDNNTRKTG